MPSRSDLLQLMLTIMRDIVNMAADPQPQNQDGAEVQEAENNPPEEVHAHLPDEDQLLLTFGKHKGKSFDFAYNDTRYRQWYVGRNGTFQAQDPQATFAEYCARRLRTERHSGSSLK